MEAGTGVGAVDIATGFDCATGVWAEIGGAY